MSSISFSYLQLRSESPFDCNKPLIASRWVRLDFLRSDYGRYGLNTSLLWGSKEKGTQTHTFSVHSLQAGRFFKSVLNQPLHPLDRGCSCGTSALRHLESIRVTVAMDLPEWPVSAAIVVPDTRRGCVSHMQQWKSTTRHSHPLKLKFETYGEYTSVSLS